MRILPGQVRLLILLLAFGLVLAGAARAQGPVAPAAPSARQIYQALNALRVDPAQIYRVRDLTLRRDVVRLSLEEGKLGFLTAYNGRITGLVFSGRGRVLAVPRDIVEKQSLARFLGEPLLDQTFGRAYIRFTDTAAEELLAQLRESGARPLNEPSFAEEWASTVSDLNPWNSLRILADLLSQTPQPYFYAGLSNEKMGAFDVLVDPRRDDLIHAGQSKLQEGVRYYNVWTSFSPQNREPPRPGGPFAPRSYRIRTTIEPDLTLAGACTVELEATGGERMVALELSRNLSIELAADAQGTPLEFFQNEEIRREDVAQRGNDSLFVVLARPPAAGERVTLDFRYRGKVIGEAGNGVYFVGDRGSWYPHVGGTGLFVPFHLEFRWPRRLTLVATGKRVAEQDQGEFRSGTWESEAPVPVAGFNLGEYAKAEAAGAPWRVELYANQNVERELAALLARPSFNPMPRRPGTTRTVPRFSAPESIPNPAALLRELGRDIADSIRFYEKLSTPFPFSRLQVAQIPGSFGQGWPGLLYLSTFSFLSQYDQSRLGVAPRTQEHFLEIVPPHEVAHQWWGNTVGWNDYRDQWINEGLANYLALMFVDAKNPDTNTLNTWLDLYRTALGTRDASSRETPAEFGPVTLGFRLRSSKSPTGFQQAVYSRGTWIFHMLRMMLRGSAQDAALKSPSLDALLAEVPGEAGAETGSAPPGKAGATQGAQSNEPRQRPGRRSARARAERDPDARFRDLLQLLQRDYRHRALTTEDLQRAVESVMTPSMDIEGGPRSRLGRPGAMDWFFDQYVRGAAIPRYALEFSSRAQGDKLIVRGKLKQSGVPDSFIAPVPLYIPGPKDAPVYLTTVIATGPETPFTATLPVAGAAAAPGAAASSISRGPKRILIDPHRTLLCWME